MYHYGVVILDKDDISKLLGRKIERIACGEDRNLIKDAKDIRVYYVLPSLDAEDDESVAEEQSDPCKDEQFQQFLNDVACLEDDHMIKASDLWIAYQVWFDDYQATFKRRYGRTTLYKYLASLTNGNKSAFKSNGSGSPAHVLGIKFKPAFEMVLAKERGMKF